MPFARLDECLESEKREEERRIREMYRAQAFLAYLTTRHDEMTFGDYCDGIGLDAGGSVEEVSQATRAEIEEAREVCALADAAVKAGGYRRVSSLKDVVRLGQVFGE